jgi:RNA polymerase sigma-70 factor (ECF subfamily)
MQELSMNQQLLGLQDHLFSFALSMTGNRDDAKDLVQETILRVYDNRDKYMEDTNFKAWVFTLMRNIFINNYRKTMRERNLMLSSEDLISLNQPHDSEATSSMGALSIGDISRTLTSLGREIRQPFVLHLLGYKYSEIADRLGIPIGTVKSRIFLARRHLMTVLKDYA